LLVTFAGLCLASAACAESAPPASAGAPQPSGDTPLVWHEPPAVEHPVPIKPTEAGFIALDHTHLITADIERAMDFYVNVLGFSVALEIHDRPRSASLDQLLGFQGASYRHAMVNLPGGPSYDTHTPWIEIWEVKNVPLDTSLNENPTKNLQGKGYNAYRVTDLEAVLKRLKEHGIRFVSEPLSRDGKPTSIYVVDPDGQILELNQYNVAPPKE